MSRSATSLFELGIYMMIVALAMILFPAYSTNTPHQSMTYISALWVFFPLYWAHIASWQPVTSG